MRELEIAEAAVEAAAKAKRERGELGSEPEREAASKAVADARLAIDALEERFRGLWRRHAAENLPS